MQAVASLLRLTGVELLKVKSKSVVWAALALLFILPVSAEILLVEVGPQDAVFPAVSAFLFGDVLIIVALVTIVVSVLALGNDFELGTVWSILHRGVPRYQFILSKITAAFIVSILYGFTYVLGALLSTFAAHLYLTTVPLSEAAGGAIVWRGLAAVLVIGLVEFVASGVVMFALVLGHSSWMGMLAGLGYVLFDFFSGGLGLINLPFIQAPYRYTISYHALSLLANIFPSGSGVGFPRGWAEAGYADPAWSIGFFLVTGCVFCAVSVFVFRRQDLTKK